MLITIKLRGETVSCGHCRAKFVAQDDTRKSNRAKLLLGRANQLLAASADFKPNDGCEMDDTESQASIQNQTVDRVRLCK